MKVTLVNPPSEKGKYEHEHLAAPKNGIGYIAAYLEKNGIDCSILDAKFEGLNFEQVIKRLMEEKPDIVGISAMTSEIESGARVAAEVKRSMPRSKTVIGGAHAISIPRETLKEFNQLGINYAVNNYIYRATAAENFILVTDEDRDNTNGALTYANVLASMTGGNFLLNAVVNATFQDALGRTALGIDSDGNDYIADGLGGYIKVAGGFASSGAGTTIADYVTLALATGGAAWDLNQLRAGGLTAQSFTEAFVDIKVGEIIIQPTPEPLTLLLLGAGLFGLGILRRRD